jgi:hypothetical protein
MTTATILSKAAEDMVAVPSSVNEDKFFDFEKAKTQAITLEQLSRTHREDDVYGNPLRGIYHFDLSIRSLMSVLSSATMWRFTICLPHRTETVSRLE